MTKDPDVREYTLTNTNGAGECKAKGASDGQPYNLAEGDCFLLELWMVDNGEPTGDKLQGQVRNYNSGPVGCEGVD